MAPFSRWASDNTKDEPDFFKTNPDKEKNTNIALYIRLSTWACLENVTASKIIQNWK